MGLNQSQCEAYNITDYPESSVFYNSLGGYAIALYVICSLVFGVLIGEYIYLSLYIFTNVPQERRILTLWVTSIHLVSSMMALVSTLAPMASEFVWTFYKGYLGIILGSFVAMTIAWHGGDKEMVNSVQQKGANFNMRVAPCCWILCLPKSTSFTRKKLRFLKGCVYQVPFVYTWVIFIMIVLNQCNLLVIGNTMKNDPYLYLNIILMGSFFFGMWALFVIFGIEKRYQLLGAKNYRTKSLLLKATVVLMNVQDFVIDFFVTHHIFRCVTEEISAKTFGTIIKNLLVTIESLILGSIVLWVYIKDETNTIDASESYLDQDENVVNYGSVNGDEDQTKEEERIRPNASDANEDHHESILL